ncbi:MAG: glycerate kinase [Gemmatimonadota bacterium]
MRVLICPTAFKGSLTAAEAARAMARGVGAALPRAEIIVLPVSDGGPGLLDALRAGGAQEVGEPAGTRAPPAAAAAGDPPREPGLSRDCRLESIEVPGPLGATVTARILWLSGASAAIESADACGLHLVSPGRRDPLRADTLGVGEMVRACVERGARRVWIGLGGSGTADGGTGAARAFGWRFLDASGRTVRPGGGGLARLARIRRGTMPKAELTALADVGSPLTGPNGAAHRFGPQKGASAADIARLDVGLARLTERIETDLGIAVAELPGAGAAGGLGAGCVAFLGAALVAGAPWVLDRVRFDAVLDSVDVAVTGEGTFDAGSLLGKVTGEVLVRCRRAEVPAILVCGRVEGRAPAGVKIRQRPGALLGGTDLAELVQGAIREMV